MPEFTQRLTMHLNGGSKFSTLDYAVYADGRPTPIVRGRRTGGRPKYLVTDDVFYCKACKAEYDVLAPGGRSGLPAWLEAHAGCEEGLDGPVVGGA